MAHNDLFFGSWQGGFFCLSATGIFSEVSKPARFKNSPLPEDELAVASRLREALDREALSLPHLADRTGIGLSALKHYVRGDAPLSLKSGALICEHLDINPHWLAIGKGEEDHPFSTWKIERAAEADRRSRARLSFHSAIVQSIVHRLDKWGRAHPEIIRRKWGESFKEMVARHSTPKLEAMLSRTVTTMRRRVGADDKAESLRLIFRIAEALQDRVDQQIPIDPMGHSDYLSTMQIGEKIKAKRKKMKMTRVQAAEKWGVPATTLRKWETGERTPRGLALKQLELILRNNNT